MRPIAQLLVLFLPATALAATYVNCTGAVSGNWTSTAIWALAAAPATCSLGPPGNGDTATVSIPVTVSTSVTVGSSPATGGTAAIALGSAGTLSITGTLTVRGNVTSSSSSVTPVTIGAGGTLKFDSTVSGSPGTTYYEFIGSGGSGSSGVPKGGIQFDGTSSDCSYKLLTQTYSGTTCATLTSDTSGGALAGDINTTNSIFLTGSYAALGPLGAASRNAITIVSTNNFYGGFQMDHWSLNGSGMIQTGAGSYYDFSATYCAMTGGVNTQDQSEDIQITESTHVTTQAFHDCAARSIKILNISSGWTTQNLFTEVPIIYSTPSSSPSNCDGQIFNVTSGSGDIFVPCSTANYGIGFQNQTGVTSHLFNALTVSATTVNYNNFYTEFPEPDAGLNQGKSITLNAANPGVSTTWNLNNWVLVPSKTGVGNAEFAGGATGSFGNVHVSIFHATAWVQGAGSGGNQFISVDESGASSYTHKDVKANIMVSDATFYKSVSFTVATPSNNSVENPDYNVAGSAYLSTNASCPNCTGQANGWTTKCTAGAGITCPAGTHDLDVVAGGFIAPSWTNSACAGGAPCQRMATWDTLGLGNVVATAWVTSTAYTKGQQVSIPAGSSPYGIAVNYICTVAHTSGASTKPDSGAAWRSNWEYSSVADLRAAIANGTTYSGNAPAKAFYVWVGTGWLPRASQYRATYPGDTNTVTNMGAFQMPAAAAVVMRHRISQ